MANILKTAASWAANRLNEKTTWFGVGLIFAAYGHNLPVEVINALSFWGPFIGSFMIALETGKAD